MMRRVIGLSLAGLGTFLIVFAIVLPTYIAGQIVKFPLNEYETATLDATGASYFNAGNGTERSPVNLEATYTIKGDNAAGTSSMAVWKEFSYVYDLTNHQGVQVQTRTFAFNRKTGYLVPYSGDSLDNKPFAQTGGLGYVFPIGVGKQTYPWFDTTLDKSEPMVYSGTTTVDGISCYVFVENVPPTKVATLSVPGSLLGLSTATVEAPEDYSIHFIYDVDPETGAPLDVNEHEVQALYNPTTNTQALTLFNADLIATPSSVKQIVGLDLSGRNELNLLKTTLPIIFGAVGAVALIVGIWLVARRPNEDVEAGPTSQAPELAAAPDLAPDEASDHVAAPAVTAEAAAAETAVNVSPATEPDPDTLPAPVAADAPAAEEAQAEQARTEEAPAAEAPTADASTTEAPAAETSTAEAPAADATAASSGTAAANGEAPPPAPRRSRRSGGGSHAKPPQS
jgi:Porin PorA